MAWVRNGLVKVPVTVPNRGTPTKDSRRYSDIEKLAGIDFQTAACATNERQTQTGRRTLATGTGLQPANIDGAEFCDENTGL